jgi:dUTPase
MATSKTNTVKVRLDEGASLPEQAHPQDVGFDVKSISCEYDVDTDTYIYHTGLYVETKEVDDITHSLYLFPRSSNCKKECYLANSVGIVDSDIYRGEIQARFKNRTSLEVMIQLETLKQMVRSVAFGGFIISYDDMYNAVKKEFISKAKRLEFAPYEVGDRCAQLVFAEETKPVFKAAKKLNEKTDRGTGGFGDSGK